MNCPQCNQFLGAEAVFCVNCGTSLQPLSVVPLHAGAAAAPAQAREIAVAVHPEETGKRIVAFLVDCIPAFAVALLSAIPLVGILFAVLFCAYWALRDITGSSPGKMMTGSVVVSSDGSPASGAQKIGRNALIALPGLFGLIPFFGWLIELPLISTIMIVEAVMLFSTGRRLGDRLAGTTVVPKSKSSF